MLTYMRCALEIFGVVFLRFRTVPRIWNVWLVGVNLGCLYFIQHIEAQVVLITTLIAVVIMTLLYKGSGFTRLLGVGHALWIPMFAWMATRLDAIATHPELQAWLVVLCVTNGVSFIVDTIDVTRYLRGDRMPSYYWAKPSRALA